MYRNHCYEVLLENGIYEEDVNDVNYEGNFFVFYHEDLNLKLEYLIGYPMYFDFEREFFI